MPITKSRKKSKSAKTKSFSRSITFSDGSQNREAAATSRASETTYYSIISENWGDPWVYDASIGWQLDRMVNSVYRSLLRAVMNRLYRTQEDIVAEFVDAFCSSWYRCVVWSTFKGTSDDGDFKDSLDVDDFTPPPEEWTTGGRLESWYRVSMSGPQPSARASSTAEESKPEPSTKPPSPAASSGLEIITPTVLPDTKPSKPKIHYALPYRPPRPVHPHPHTPKAASSAVTTSEMTTSTFAPEQYQVRYQFTPRRDKSSFPVRHIVSVNPSKIVSSEGPVLNRMYNTIVVLPREIDGYLSDISIYDQTFN